MLAASHIHHFTVFIQVTSNLDHNKNRVDAGITRQCQLWVFAIYQNFADIKYTLAKHFSLGLSLHTVATKSCIQQTLRTTKLTNSQSIEF